MRYRNTTVVFSIQYTYIVGKQNAKLAMVELYSVNTVTRRWIDNIKMDLLGIGVSVVDWIGLAQDRYRWRALVNSVMNLRVP
jgi:hypothetical protein